MELHFRAGGLAAVDHFQAVGAHIAVYIVVADAVPGLSVLVEQLAVHPHNGAVLDVLEGDVAVAGGAHAGAEAQVALDGASFAFIGLHQRAFVLLLFLLHSADGEGDGVARGAAIGVHLHGGGHAAAAFQLVAIAAHGFGIGADGVLALVEGLALLEKHVAVCIGIVDHNLRRLRLGLLRLVPFGLFRFIPLRLFGLVPFRLFRFVPLGLLRLGVLFLFLIAPVRTAPAGTVAVAVVVAAPAGTIAAAPARTIVVIAVVTPARTVAAALFRLLLTAPVVIIAPAAFFLLRIGHGHAGHIQRAGAGELVVVIHLNFGGRHVADGLRIHRLQVFAVAGNAGETAFVNHQPHRLFKRFLRHGQPVQHGIAVHAGLALRMLGLAVHKVVQRHLGHHAKVLARQRSQGQRQLAQQHQHAEHKGSRTFEPARILDHV